MKMGDLERATGVSRSTIRGYLQMGLLRPPKQVGPRTYLFDEQHVETLERIRAMRKQGQPLREIRRQLGSPASAGASPGEASADDGDRRGEIRAVATRMFAEQGYDSVRLSDIAGAAGITKAALYRYFDGKESLFVECVEQIRLLIVPVEAREEQGKQPNLTARGAWRARVALENYDTYRMVASFLMMVIFGRDATLAAKAREAYESMVTDVRDDMAQAARVGLYRDGVDFDLHCYMLFGALMGAGLKMTTDPSYSLEDALASYMDLMAHGTIPQR